MFCSPVAILSAILFRGANRSIPVWVCGCAAAPTTLDLIGVTRAGVLSIAFPLVLFTLVMPVWGCYQWFVSK
jgi:hypothetical protein